MTTKAISSKQRRIINFIQEYFQDKGYPPIIRDIAKGCQISSTSVVALDRLEEAGYIRRHSDISRGIEFLDRQQGGRKLVYIPIVGTIAAGDFIEPNRICLEPANSQMKPIYTSPDNVEIQGSVVAVIRRMP